jgi:hypothetical protein
VLARTGPRPHLVAHREQRDAAAPAAICAADVGQSGRG